MSQSTLSQRLNDLDDRVFRLDKPYSADRWRRKAARWWLFFLGAVSMLTLADLLWINGTGSGWVLIGPAIAFAFSAGWRSAEHDRFLRRERGFGLRVWAFLRRPAELS